MLLLQAERSVCSLPKERYVLLGQVRWVQWVGTPVRCGSAGAGGCRLLALDPVAASTSSCRCQGSCQCVARAVGPLLGLRSL